jgi:hypothetical protein
MKGFGATHWRHNGRNPTIATSQALKIIGKAQGAKSPKNSSIKSVVDREGWKVSMLKGIYVAKMSALI